MLRRLATLVVMLPLAAAGCAATPKPNAAGDGDALARPAACDAELRAFAAVARLAKQNGDDWTIFEPAIEALKEQIMDCVQDSYGGPLAI